MPKHTKRAQAEREDAVLRHIEHDCQPDLLCRLETYEDENNLYLETKYARGYESLYDYITSRPLQTLQHLARDPSKALEAAVVLQRVRVIVCNLIRALQHLHRNGAAHGDVKPENVLVDPKTGQVELIDFDLACVADNTAAASASGDDSSSQPRCRYATTGTPRYMAPEIAHRHLNAAYGLRDWELSDFWSLGMTIFALITGTDFYVARAWYLLPKPSVAALPPMREADIFATLANPSAFAVPEALGPHMTGWLSKHAPDLLHMLLSLINFDSSARERVDATFCCADESTGSRPTTTVTDHPTSLCCLVC
jgi:serine/threonine protein kinase